MYEYVFRISSAKISINYELCSIKGRFFWIEFTFVIDCIKNKKRQPKTLLISDPNPRLIALAGGKNNRFFCGFLEGWQEHKFVKKHKTIASEKKYVKT